MNPSRRQNQGEFSPSERSPVFVFPGHGTIFARMGGELHQSSPGFARHLADCQDAFSPHLDWSVIDVVTGRPGAPDYQRIDVLEPVLVCLAIALARTWVDAGVQPAAVVGFSLGEIPAAGFAGAMSLEETARVTVAVAEAQATLAGTGAMAGVKLSKADATERIAGIDGIEVVGELSPRFVVISGASEGITGLVGELRSERVAAQEIPFDFAPHSPLVGSLQDTLLAALGQGTMGGSRIPIYSSLTGGVIETDGRPAAHWYEVMREPFSFNQAVLTALDDGHDAFVEFNPHSNLGPVFNEIFAAADSGAVALSTMRRDRQGLDRLTASLQEAAQHGLVTELDSPASSFPAESSSGTVAPAVSETVDVDAAIDELLDTVVARVTKELASVAGAAPPLAPDEVRLLGEDARDVSMFDLGLSSFELIVLQERLQEETGVELESTFVLDHLTVALMVAEIRDRSGAAGAQTSASARVIGPTNTATGPTNEPIAIVGMSMRLPGRIRNRSQLWGLLANEIDPVRPIDPARWSYSPLDTSEITTTDGGYLENIDQFAPLFFKISPKEAMSMDPQQRLLLELTWEALEDAGADPFEIGHDRRIGTYIGIVANDYLQVGRDMGVIPDAYTTIGSLGSTAVGRIAHVLGFEGPSLAVDVACASSVHALHLGSEALRQGTCDAVVAGAVNLILSPEPHISFSRLGALSPSGRCRSFDESADGYIRSEGGAIVILKRLSDAERDGDDIVALITGSSINHNGGGGGGFTVPNGKAQAHVITEALSRAGLTIDDISYLEAHGSATPIGDPQEVNAAARVFAGRREPLPVSSVKSNLGHLEVAAGMAGLCRVIASMEHGQIPPTLHFRGPNPLVDWERIPIRVADRLMPWEPTDGPRRAGLSSFGLNGANAHAIIEQYDSNGRISEGHDSNGHGIVGQDAVSQDAVGHDADPGPVPRLIPVSANAAGAVTEALHDIGAWATKPSARLDNLSYTWSRRRSLPYRRAVVADTIEDVAQGVAGGPEPQPVPADTNPVVFVFAGQGTQYPGMALELYRSSSQVRSVLDQLDAEFAEVADISILDRLHHGDEEAFGTPLVNQPLIYSVEMALAAYWRSMGVTPAAVLGHSIGEYAAACVAGVMTRRQAVELVAHRAQVMAESTAKGSMATVMCSLEKAQQLVESHRDVAVAAVNAPENITISGEAESLAEVLKLARKQRIFVERLSVSHPFHSPLMVPSAERLLDRIEHHTFMAPSIAWTSTLSGSMMSADEPVEADHWSRHLVEPVLFADALQVVMDHTGDPTFVEIGTMATLGGLIAQQVDAEVLIVPSLRQGRSDVRQFLESVGTLWENGHAVDFAALPQASGRLVHDLPPRPFARDRVWLTPPTGAEAAERRSVAVADPVNDQEPPGQEPAMEEAVPMSETQNLTTEESIRQQQRGEVLDAIVQSLHQISGVEVELLGEDTELFALGVDSLMLVQMGNRITKRFGVDIPIRTFFESLHTVGVLVDYVADRMPIEIPEPDLAPIIDLDASPPPQLTVVAESSAPTPAPEPAEPAMVSQPSVAPPVAGVQTGYSMPAVSSPAVPLAAGVEGIVQAQLGLMRQQLELLNGGSPTANLNPAPASPPAAAAASADGPLPAISAPPATPSKPKANFSDQYNNIALEDDDLTPEQAATVAAFVAEHVAKTGQSKEYAAKHRETLADWIASLNFNPSLKETVYPVVSARSDGAYFWDLDGNRYLDTTMGYGVHFFGHQPDFLVDALQTQLACGYELGPQNLLAGEVAELIHEMTGAQRVAFCNTGTEAVMVALRLARAVSGRDKIVRFTTAFHGSFDGVLAESDGENTMPMSIGIPQSMVDDTMVLTYGSRRSLDPIRENADQIAAVLVEPVQTRNLTNQPVEFLRDLRKICTEHDIALIFDEIVVGFRVEIGGAQTYFGIESDMSLYGKLVAGGMPIGIIAGRADYLNAVDGGSWSDGDDSKPAAPTTFFAGTFCKHPLTMAACRAVLLKLREEGDEKLAEINDRTARFAQLANDFFTREHVPLRVVYFSSVYRYETVPAQDMSGLGFAANLFFKLLLHHGVFVWEKRLGFFTMAHTDEHIDEIMAALGASLATMRAGGFEFLRAGAPMPATI